MFPWGYTNLQEDYLQCNLRTTGDKVEIMDMQQFARSAALAYDTNNGDLLAELKDHFTSISDPETVQVTYFAGMNAKGTPNGFDAASLEYTKWFHQHFTIHFLTAGYGVDLAAEEAKRIARLRTGGTYRGDRT
jgi:hypothetical protein